MAVYTSIDNPELFFQCKIYAGDGNSTQAITLDGDEDMQPNLVWLKNRTDQVWHVWTDSVQGAGAANGLSPNSTEGSGGGNKASYGFLSAFGSDGFTVSEGSSNASMSNQSSKNYVAWCWKESADAGFDIVSYTGNGSNRTISHSLSAVPHVYIAKSVGETYGWQIYHHKNTSAPETDYLEFKTDATVDEATSWNDTAPTSSVFSLGTTDAINKNTVEKIAYLFAPKQGYSKFGSFVANSNTNGPFIYTGFRPALVIGKCASDTNNWFIFDNKRSSSNPVDDSVYPDSDAAENTNHIIDFLSNGFKIRDSDGTVNSTGNTYIYLAFAEAPFVNSNGVPCNAR